VTGRMGRSVVTAVAALALAAPGFAASGAPVLVAATSMHRHVVVRFTVGDLQPWFIEIAVSPATEASGAFLPGRVRLRERVGAHPDPVTGIVRWRTFGMLAPRTYYVHVSGIEGGGVTDCPVQLPDCIVRWSKARILRVG
jgi:hypothetical protein